MKTVRGHWFVEWAEANGNPDFTDPIIYRFEEEFDKRVAGLGAWKQPPSGLLRRFVRKGGDRLEPQLYRTTSSSAWKARIEILRIEVRGPALDHLLVS